MCHDAARDGWSAEMVRWAERSLRPATNIIEVLELVFDGAWRLGLAHLARLGLAGWLAGWLLERFPR